MDSFCSSSWCRDPWLLFLSLGISTSLGLGVSYKILVNLSKKPVAIYASLVSVAAWIGISGVFGSIVRKFILSPAGSGSLVVALITHTTAPLAALATMIATDAIFNTTTATRSQKDATSIGVGFISGLITGWTLDTVLTLIVRGIHGAFKKMLCN